MHCRCVAIVFAIGLIGCTSGKQGPPEIPPPAVTVIQPVEADVQTYHEYNGMLDAVQSVMIQARVEGFLEKVLFKEGEEVKVDAPLYLIDPREYASAVAKARSDIAKAKADIANAKAQIALAEAELNRLTQAGGASKSEIDKATATLAANKAMLDVAEANRSAAEAAERTALLKLSYTDIKAPIAGRISRTLVTPGNLVGQKDATMLTSIVSVDPVYVYFDVPEKDLLAYQKLLANETKKGPIPVAVGLGTEEGYPHPGILDFQENRVEPGSGTIRVRGVLENPVDPKRGARMLYPGMYCRVRVPIGSPKPMLAIPEEALMTGQEGRFVYVIGPENVIQKRTVVLGPPVWRMTIGQPPAWMLGKAPVRSVVSVESGLAPGDRIVAVGLLKARLGQAVTPEDWEFKGPEKPKAVAK